MAYVFREVEEKDLDEIQEIEEDSFFYPFSRWQFHYYYLNHRQTFFVAEERNKLVGYIIGVKSLRKATVASLAVRREERRKGIATKLIQYLKEKLRGRVRGIELQVRLSNKPAILFYENLGFIRKKILSYYYQNSEDAFLYYMPL